MFYCEGRFQGFLGLREETYRLHVLHDEQCKSAKQTTLIASYSLASILHQLRITELKGKTSSKTYRLVCQKLSKSCSFLVILLIIHQAIKRRQSLQNESKSQLKSSATTYQQYEKIGRSHNVDTGMKRSHLNVTVIISQLNSI